jgi:hypothetical protein
MKQKPDWKDAPEWATWLAMDDDGEGYFYEDPPSKSKDGFWETKDNGSRWEQAEADVDWETTLEERPQQ